MKPSNAAFVEGKWTNSDSQSGASANGLLIWFDKLILVSRVGEEGCSFNFLSTLIKAGFWFERDETEEGIDKDSSVKTEVDLDSVEVESVWIGIEIGEDKVEDLCLIGNWK